MKRSAPGSVEGDDGPRDACRLVLASKSTEDRGFSALALLVECRKAKVQLSKSCSGYCHGSFSCFRRGFEHFDRE